MATPRRPRDVNQLAKLVVDLSTGELLDDNPNVGKDPAAIKRGRAGGLKGGRARASALPEKERKRIAKQAAAARWRRKKDV